MSPSPHSSPLSSSSSEPVKLAIDDYIHLNKKHLEHLRSLKMLKDDDFYDYVEQTLNLEITREVIALSDQLKNRHFTYMLKHGKFPVPTIHQTEKMTEMLKDSEPTKTYTDKVRQKLEEIIRKRREEIDKGGETNGISN